ncbi:hypothetical protein FBQ81_07265 [Chloroflexi bacterium CFX6]|nr:hypothetical protein [Chloroflexi bacterium CFX6]
MDGTLNATDDLAVEKIELFLEDWAALFNLIQEGKNKSVIAGKFSVLEAVQTNALFESGEATGNIVLLALKFLQAE